MIEQRVQTEDDLVDLITRHGTTILRVARQFSRSSADAEDAYQRTFEKLLTRPPQLDEKGDPLPWLLTVVRNEALMIGRAQKYTADLSIDDLPEAWDQTADSPADRVVALESVEHGREALLRINPDQARCLLLRADGLSYNEIVAETGFSFAKVQRSLADGRRVYRGLLDRIEGGAECRRLEPLVSRFVDGELPAAQRQDIELHLTGCGACRSLVRDYADAPSEVASLFPVGIAVSGRFYSRIMEAWNDATTWLSDRVLSHIPSLPSIEPAIGKKAAVATLAAGSLLAGGVGIESAVTDSADQAVQTQPVARAAASVPVISKQSRQRTAREHRIAKRRARAAREVNATDLLRSTGGDSSDSPSRSAGRSEPAPRFDDGSGGEQEAAPLDQSTQAPSKHTDDLPDP